MDEETRQGIINLWNEGKTGSQIAKTFGVTRNSVIGLVNRMRKNGHRLRGKTATKPEKAGVQKPIATRIESNIVLEEDVAEDYPVDNSPVASVFDQYFEPPASGKTLMFLDMASCRFIVSPVNADMAIYCGKKIALRSYCAEHASLCYVPARPASPVKKFNMRFP